MNPFEQLQEDVAFVKVRLSTLEGKLETLEAAESKELVSRGTRIWAKLKPMARPVLWVASYVLIAVVVLLADRWLTRPPRPIPPNPAPPTPTPIPPAPGSKSFFFMVLEDKLKPFPGRGDFFADKALWDGVKARHSWRNWDVNTPNPPKEYLPYLKYAQGQTLPYVVIVNQTGGGLVFSGALPTNAADFLKLLHSKGG